MTKRKIDKINNRLDEVYEMMLNAGYDKGKLNSVILVNNISTLSDEHNAFNEAIDYLLKINERLEFFEICIYLIDIQHQLNNKRTKEKVNE
ncbi:hypothetical protein OQZ33_06995 [Pedobacter sp. MC2016-05]|uniref:hypothetical protein n=1 Tax=Pedobacter sp. MC2016-05 TaxID=2994474 RepID=UPI002247E3F8|nr:hypothetical protein [Pedobacter sp. MC2016-05]MCX2474071.1 hypothetical protein [Pedobacter sp. MC2016-05]